MQPGIAPVPESGQYPMAMMPKDTYQYTASVQVYTKFYNGPTVQPVPQQIPSSDNELFPNYPPYYGPPPNFQENYDFDHSPY